MNPLFLQTLAPEIDRYFSDTTQTILTSVAISTLIFIASILIIGAYIYTSLAWYTIARKLNHRHSWLAWIPIAAWAQRLTLGNIHWAWIFLILIPIFGWIALFVLLIIATWRIYDVRKYPGWFSLAVILPQIGYIFYLVIIGFVAWKDRKRKMRL